MAAPLPKEDRAKIVDYLRQQDLSDLTGVEIKELVKDNLRIDISQPTAAKLKGEILEDDSDDEEFIECDSPLERPTLSEETGVGTEPTKPDKIRQLSIEQQNAIEHLLQGQSDRAAAEAAGVSRQTVWAWRNNDILFITELNRQRVELWSEARVRLKSMANRAIDVLEQQLSSSDPKVSLAAARYILQSTRLLGDTDLPIEGPMSPKTIIMEDLRKEARRELAAKEKQIEPKYPVFDIFESEHKYEKQRKFNAEVEALARSRLKEALKKVGLA
jgi:hypothetical protein